MPQGAFKLKKAEGIRKKKRAPKGDQQKLKKGSKFDRSDSAIGPSRELERARKTAAAAADHCLPPDTTDHDIQPRAHKAALRQDYAAQQVRPRSMPPLSLPPAAC
eukprot:scaffold259860_cov36-Tisochrysis_lutea.AAC.2